ncbi:MAG: alpha/beta hydrolase [Candidatus Tectimicrobiota bacterium]|nr:MAG: alpha/beta hydrolase [Candidatus Tectomicrobia bacterium]
MHETTLDLRGLQVRLLRGGRGLPLLYLHDTFTLAWLPVHNRLATACEVFFPVHPGCAGAAGLEHFDDLEDLVFYYLDLCEALHLERPVLLGASLGGWLAAEMAVRYSHLLRGLVLVGALGLHLPAAPATDLFRLDPAQVRAALFADPTAPLAQRLVPDTPDPAALPSLLQARQMLARFAWQFPDNPKLARYLYRVRLPTLIVWGAQDGVVPPAHGQAYQEAIAGSQLVVLPQCGHLPHAEQPEAFARVVLDWLARLTP